MPARRFSYLQQISHILNTTPTLPDRTTWASCGGPHPVTTRPRDALATAECDSGTSHNQYGTLIGPPAAEPPRRDAYSNFAPHHTPGNCNSHAFGGLRGSQTRESAREPRIDGTWTQPSGEPAPTASRSPCHARCYGRRTAEEPASQLRDCVRSARWRDARRPRLHGPPHRPGRGRQTAP